MNKKVKVLGLVQGEYSSHTMRVLEVCKRLNELYGFEVKFSGRGPFLKKVESAGFPFIDTETITKREINDVLEKRLIPKFYTQKNVNRLFEAENSLLSTENPDIIVRDHFRELAGISAKLHDIFDVTIQHGCANPNYHFSFRPENFPKTLDAIFPKGSLKPVARIIEKVVRRIATKELKNKAKEFGLNNSKDMHEGVNPDLVLIPESEILFPNLAPNEHFKYIGPMFLMDQGKDPDWLPDFSADERKKILITGGTTGEHEKSNIFFDAFSDEKYACALYSNDSPINSPDNFHGIGIFSLPNVVPHTNLFITHGGIGSTYLGLFHGKPMLVIHNHFEQHSNSHQLEQITAGIGLGHRSATPERIRELSDKILSDPKYLKRALEVSNSIKSQENPGDIAAKYIKNGYEKYRQKINS